MRVLVEFFDRNPLENVLSSCIFKPDVVVYLCDKRDSAYLKEAAIYRLFKRRKLKTRPRFYYFNAAEPNSICLMLEAVVRDYPTCVFDFSGGRDLMLLVAGAFFAQSGQPGFYIDAEAGRFINLRGCEEWQARFAMPVFSAEDIFTMAGAALQGSGHFKDAISAEMEEDVLRIFSIVEKNPRAWGEFASWLQGFCAGVPSGEVHIRGPRRTKSGYNTCRANPVLLQNLHQAGIITQCELAKNHVTLTFKSALLRRCLMVEGIWLEMYGYVIAKRSGFFGDVRTSVVIDWDGIAPGADGARNEVDVLMVQGVVSLFVSCKMSLPTALALSEIRLLATKFGGRHSRAAVLTMGVLGDEHKALRARAKDLGIAIIDRPMLAAGQLPYTLNNIARGVHEKEEEPFLVNPAELPQKGLYR